MTEDIYTNGSATLGSPSHSNGREVRKIRLIQFEKVTEEPMVRAGKIPKPGGTQGDRGAGRAVPTGWPWGKQEIAGDLSHGKRVLDPASCLGTQSEPHQRVVMLVPRGAAAGWAG